MKPMGSAVAGSRDALMPGATALRRLTLGCRCKDPGCDFTKRSMWRGPPSDKLAKVAPSSVACRGNMLARGEEHAFCLNSLR